MECTRVEQEEIIERYLNGALSPEDRDAFEMHCLGCAHCADLLQTYQAVQTELREGHRGYEVGARRKTWWWRLAWLTAAVVLFAGGVALWQRYPAEETRTAPQVAATPTTPSTARQPSLTELAQVTPPPYVLPTLRSSPDEAAALFLKGMQSYVKGDYAGAIPALRRAAQLSPKAAEAQFFLGICLLLTEKNDAAVERFRATIALGKTLYLEGARYYLAKAYLRQNKLEAAEEELRETVKLEGDLAPAAQELLEKVQSIRRQE